jgi:ABC-type multidrug transport system ATPase subunit
MSNYIIKTTGVNYTFRNGFKTLHDVNLQVPEGSVFGFLGPNGAGKTTTLRLLLGLLKKQEGTIEVFGEDLATNRISILQRIGSLIEQPSLYGHLTAKENLEIYRKLNKVTKQRVAEVLQLVGLEDTGSKKAKQFSLGMKQRLSIAIALLHQPKLLILDEPTNGLDPNGIIETRELIKRLNTEFGVTILVSSHILAEIEKMATHVGIIHKGKFLFQGTLQQLHQMQAKENQLQVATNNNDAALQLLQAQFKVERQNGHLILPFASKEESARINRTLVENGLEVHHLHAEQTNLEQLFIDLTSN